MSTIKNGFGLYVLVSLLGWVIVGVNVLALNYLGGIIWTVLTGGMFTLTSAHLYSMSKEILPSTALYLESAYKFRIKLGILVWILLVSGIVVYFTVFGEPSFWVLAVVYVLILVTWIKLCQNWWTLIFECTLPASSAKPKVVVVFVPTLNTWVLRYSKFQFVGTDGGPSSLEHALSRSGFSGDIEIAREAIKLGYHPIPD